jgi:hypothetical protein
VICQPEELPLIGKISAEERILSGEERGLLEAMDRIEDALGEQRLFTPI